MKNINNDDGSVYENGEVVINNNNKQQQQCTIIDLTDEDNYGIDTESDTDIDYDSVVMTNGQRKLTSGSNNTVDMMNFQDSTSEINSSSNKRRHRTKPKRKSNIQIGDDGYDTDSYTDYHVMKTYKLNILDTNDISVLNSDSETDTSFVFYEKILKSTEYGLNDYEDDRVGRNVKLKEKSVIGTPDIDIIEHKVVPLTELNFIEETDKNHESLEEIHHSKSTIIIQPTTTHSTQLSSNSQYSVCDDNLLQTSQTSVSSVSFITTRSQPKPLQSQKSPIHPNTSSISYNSLAFKSKMKLPFNQPRIRIGLSKRTKLESLHPKFNKQ
ncbi:unnamed protein product [[Candida] boidinii]|uniref:Unnamed protein product n=1 Tax=Candida boidinii TaxID=5477 RepID=A0A9W6T6S0_CANBO|nr:unnamed protein product [[Candida] boidinii]GMG00403.1 unnamed protein product [[Candida] boidinii]